MKKVFCPLAAFVIATGAFGAQTIPRVIAAGAKVQVVQEGFRFTEGPVGTADGGLYFSDAAPGAERTYLMVPDGRVTVFREHTNRMNGLALAPDGGLLGVESAGLRVSRVAPNGGTTTLTEGTKDRKLLGPNDLIVDRRGGIYFTDPAPRPIVPGRKAYVYYLPAGAKEPMVIDDSLPFPNGLTLTLNGRKLIVDDTIGDTVFQFDIRKDGTAGNKRPFAKLQDVQPGKESGGDGLAIDRDGRLFIATASGVQVFDKGGKYLGTVQVPRQPTNVAFAGPGKKTLYITAREGLYKIETLTAGPNRLGK